MFCSIQTIIVISFHKFRGNFSQVLKDFCIITIDLIMREGNADVGVVDTFHICT